MKDANSNRDGDTFRMRYGVYFYHEPATNPHEGDEELGPLDGHGPASSRLIRLSGPHSDAFNAPDTPVFMDDSGWIRQEMELNVLFHSLVVFTSCDRHLFPGAAVIDIDFLGA